MKQGWLGRLRHAWADRSWDGLVSGSSGGARSLEGLCQELLTSGHGEVFLVTLAREILRVFEAASPEVRREFFVTLAERFGPDLEGIARAAPRFLETGEVSDLLALGAAVEARRRELFRRLNMAPQGTSSLVRMRQDLLGWTQACPPLRFVDLDLKHLLSSWFNRGFLELRAITWRTPAHVLEKLILYESVHEIQGWDDLRRRLAADRRCFAFFHPAMPDEPLIFVEVALAQGVQTSIRPLIDPGARLLDPAQADTAVFYSINNTQAGLRGISFGSFLLKQVIEELKAELPALRRFVTLSPMPGFAAALRAGLTPGADAGLPRALVEALLEEHPEVLGALSARGGVASLPKLLEDPPARLRPALSPLIEKLGLAYLLQAGPRGLLDPVARFHLTNGARLEGINPFANPSPAGRERSYGAMVNYLYLPEELEGQHERFVSQGEVAMSRSLARVRRRMPSLR